MVRAEMSLPSPESVVADQNVGLSASDMLQNAQKTTEFLKALSHPARLVILCRLAEGPVSVGELEDFLQLPQSAVSKQLARLREDDLVDCRRDGRTITYSLKDETTRRIIRALYDEFCA